MPFRQIPSPSTVTARRSLPRALAIVVLGFQALLWGGGSILEAQAVAESLTRYSHVEDEGTKCPPIHSHLDCLICRTLKGGAAGNSATAIVPVASGIAERPALASGVVAGQWRTGALGSRAPPCA